MAYVFVPTWAVGTSKVFGYTLILITITFFVLLLGMRRTVIKHWDKYRCSPLILPFAEFFGYDSSDTLSQCISKNVSDATGPVVKPYEDLFSVMKSTNMDMSSSLEDIRGVMKALKENVTDSFNNVMTKMGNMGSTAQFLMMKIQAMVQKLLALYVTLLYFAWSMMKGLEAMIKDPVLIGAQGTLDTAVKLVEKPGKGLKQVGKALKKGAKAVGKSAKKTGKKIKKAFCFGPMTRVLLDDGKFKDMVDIKIGDKLLGGSIVTGTMKFNSKDTYLVDNSGIISTFDHHVLHNGIFKKSGSVPNAKVYTGQIPYLYDIDTSNHRITILNDNNEHIVYTDFTEVDHDNNYVYEYELSLLNNSIRKQTSPNSYIS
jgi:hypothetical protein